MTLASLPTRLGDLPRGSRAGARAFSCAIGALLLATTACSDAPTSALAAPSAPSRAVTAASSDASLLACAPAAAASASRLITPAGGLLTAGGHAIAIPRGAVARPTRFTITVPASRFIEVDISAEGTSHYQFRRPVVVTLDYSRCGAAADGLASTFTAWHVDQPSLSFLADMGGIDDRFSRRLIFLTDHLSGYAVAYRAAPPPPTDESE